MKWAPNKKLHFEVAIIKAIQSLGQATLDEVIEKLGELRDGGGGPPGKSAAVAAGVSSSSSYRAAGTAATTEARVEEKSDTIEPQKLWERVLAKIPAQKGFVRTQLQQPTFLESKGAIINSVSRLATSP